LTAFSIRRTAGDASVVRAARLSPPAIVIAQTFDTLTLVGVALVEAGVPAVFRGGATDRFTGSGSADSVVTAVIVPLAFGTES